MVFKESPPIRERILSRFEEPIPGALVEFAKHVAALETDYVFCMARKAARLLDLLTLAECPRPPRQFAYHHVLDQDLARYAGKSITLIDDTLILGTTLGRAERLLKEAGAASVSTVVFAADIDLWDKALVSPAQIFLKLSHDAILTFCSAEVHSLAAFAIPYLTDFPMTADFRLTRPTLESMQGLGYWETVPLPLSVNAREGSASYSAVPIDGGDGSIGRAFGKKVARLVSLTKVRIYSRRTSNGAYWTRVVPIATLVPLKVDAVERLFETLVAMIERTIGQRLESLRADMTRPIAKLRVTQYLLSAVVGQGYLLDLARQRELNRNPGFSFDEAARLFGPWLRKDITHCHKAIDTLLDSEVLTPAAAARFDRSDLPIDVAEVARTECAQFVAGPNEKSGALAGSRTLRTDLERIFLRLHKTHELAAREEVRRFGERIFTVPREEAPHRDRLKFGFDWRTIAQIVLTREGLKATPRRVMRLSFLLDALIDAGIAVPFLCERDGVLFRAYRHGEDVPFANQEFALAYDAAAGFLEGAERDTIPRLMFEKLLVSLLRIGVAKKFLLEVHGRSGVVSGIARIGFHLHGAVATMPSDDSLLADHQDSWLSRFLVDNAVMKKKPSGHYGLGERPDAALILTSSSDEARQLGYVIGILMRAKDEAGASVLSDEDLTILATCARPRDTALALAAELNIMLRNAGALPRKLEELPARARIQHKALINSLYYLAMHSARKKYTAYKSGAPAAIVARCEAYLSATHKGPIMSGYWRALWEPVLAVSDSGQKERFDPWVDQCYERILHHAQGIFTIELALVSRAVTSGKKENRALLERSCEKTFDFFKCAPDAVVDNPLCKRLLTIALSKTPIDHAAEAVCYGHAHYEKMGVVSRVTVSQIMSVARDYGRLDERTNYQYALWYDVIDSTGQKSGLKGDALRSYRGRVRRFKDRMIEHLGGLVIEARRRHIDIYPWANSLASKDDEKNVFVRGPRSLEMVKAVVEILVNEARASRVRVRAMAIDTRFAGEPAHKYASDPNVDGEAFWEHGSRLKQGLKQLEAADATHASYLWFANDLARRPERLFNDEMWLAHQGRGEIDTTIENFPLSTAYVGGPLLTITK